MKYSESEEMYLETILLLKNRGASARSVDVAEELGYSRPSVSRAVSLLQKKGYLTVGAGGELALTDAGAQRAAAVYERHRVITRLLVSLGAAPDLAEDNACRIEHVITDDLFDVLKKHLADENKALEKTLEGPAS